MEGCVTKWVYLIKINGCHGLTRKKRGKEDAFKHYGGIMGGYF
jgi:hypothetical protein